VYKIPIQRAEFPLSQHFSRSASHCDLPTGRRRRLAGQLIYRLEATTIEAMDRIPPFQTGSIVLVTLNSPREKFWGAVLDITPAGISIRGLDLNSFDEVTSMLRTNEPVQPATVFFPLNRVERMELEQANGPIPSLLDRFQSKSGRPAAEFLDVLDDGGPF
jgi:hypothetical protein